MIISLHGKERIMTIVNRAERAVELRKNGGYNCAQAVAAAYANRLSLSESQLKQVAAGFAGGMGNMEATCGALIGAGIVAGLKTEGMGTVKLTRQIQETFKERCGAITCKDLKRVTDGKPLCPCEECVRQAALICGEVLGI